MGESPWIQGHGLLLAGLLQESSGGELTAGGEGRFGEGLDRTWVNKKEGGSGPWIDGNKALIC